MRWEATNRKRTITMLLFAWCWSNTLTATTALPPAVPPTKSNPHKERNEAYLTVQDMHDVSQAENDVSTDCWINIVQALNASPSTKQLLAPSSTRPHESQFSAGANFCSSMDLNRKQAMALGLTKCHLLGSGLSYLIPDMCQGDGVSVGNDGIGMQACLSNLEQTPFLIYSQFFTHTEMMCIKLTEDLRIHRKNHVLDRFEETARVMDSRMQQMDGVLGRYEESALMLDRIKASADMMDEKIESMRQIENVTQLLRDQIDTVDERIESMISNTIANSMEKTTSSFMREVRA
jgi:hypothetical protein